jgi:hypothetical protein
VELDKAPMTLFKLSRRAALRFLIASSASALLPARAATSSPVIAGAIRWDAWEAAGTTVIQSVQKTLGPSQYQRRAPFCAKPTSSKTISFGTCNTQSTIDAEIAYAAGAGLSYWAYCWYGPDDPMMNAWNYHQRSIHRNRVNWCLLLQFGNIRGPSHFLPLLDTYIRYFSQANYQKVLGGRPLMYIYLNDTKYLAESWNGDWANVRNALSTLGANSMKAGLATPYIVIMHGRPSEAKTLMEESGADAISNYMGLVPTTQAASYTALDTSVQGYWAMMAKTGASVVPICMTGWDPRPRIPQVNPYVRIGEPAQIASHIKSAISYVDGHPLECPARTILIYSWDECDEGGSVLAPTYSSNGSNDAILNAVGKVLRQQ